MKNVLAFLILLCCLFSCNRESNFFLGEMKISHSLENEYNLIGSKLTGIDTVGPLGINFLPEYIMITLYKSPSFLEIYDRVTYKSIGQYFSKGNGPGESLALSVLNQEMDSVAMLQDYIKKQVLTMSLKEVEGFYEATVKKVADYTCFVDPLQVFFYNDSLLLIKSLDIEKGLIYSLYDFKNKNVLKEYVLYNEVLDQSDLNRIMTLADALKPDKSKLVSLTGAFNQIDILDLDNPARNISISIGDENMSLEWLRKHQPDECPDFYISLPRCNDEYIIALHQDVDSKKAEFHVINWEGKALYRLKTDEELRDFNIDWENAVLYGISETDEVYVYSLKEVKL